MKRTRLVWVRYVQREASTCKHHSEKPPPTKKRRPSRRNRGSDSDEESAGLIQSEDKDGADETNAQEDRDANPTTQLTSFPIVITTYEMIIKDRVHLAKYDGGQVIVEGHRLKNMDSILMQEMKKYPSAGRMLLTGTPFHVSVVRIFSCCMPPQRSSFRRTPWQNFGLSSTLSCQKSLTTWRSFSNVIPTLL